MAEMPRLSPGNPAVVELEDWLRGQREAARDAMQGTDSRITLFRAQGRAELLDELLRNVRSGR